MKDDKGIFFDNLGGGLVTEQAPHKIGDTQFQVSENYDVYPSYTKIRNGYSTVSGVGTTIRNVNWHSTLGYSVSANLYTYVSWKSKIYRSYSGSSNIEYTSDNITWSALSGSPSGCRYITLYRNRLVAISSASVVYFSAFDVDTGWTAYSEGVSGLPTDDLNGGCFPLNTNDDDIPTGLVDIGSGLVILKKWTVATIAGDLPRGRVVWISRGIGCFAPLSVVKFEGFAIFLSYDGIYCVTANKVWKIDKAIETNIRNCISYTTICAGRYYTRYIIWLQTNATTRKCYVFDTATILDNGGGKWWEYTYNSTNTLGVYYMHWTTDARLIAIVNTTGSNWFIVNFQSGNRDNTTAIIATARTKDITTGRFDTTKLPTNVLIASTGSAVSGSSVMAINVYHNSNQKLIVTTSKTLDTSAGVNAKIVYGIDGSLAIPEMPDSTTASAVYRERWSVEVIITQGNDATRIPLYGIGLAFSDRENM